MIAPAVPMPRLAVRAVHPHHRPGLQWVSLPSATNPSTPMPGPEASSLAMNTHVSEVFSAGLSSASCENSVVRRATCPRQSVVPRPKSLSPSTVKLKGSTSPRVGVSGNDVQVAADEAQHILGGAGAGILDDQVTATFRVRHVLDFQGPPFSFR